MSAKVAPERIKRQIHLHALPIGWEQLDYPTFLQRRRALIAKATREGFSRLWGTEPVHKEATVRDLIAAGESQTTEFKSTGRFNGHTGQADPKLEHVIVKTVCGFLNAEGGTLLIGVNDDGDVLGLENDFGTLSKSNADGYELFIRQLLDSNLSQTTAATVRTRFEKIDGKDVCVVSVAASGKPVFARPPKGSASSAEEFWVRSGNSTKQLHSDDLLSYKQDRWD
jgi:predicted HTH transcriptional regulator